MQSKVDTSPESSFSKAVACWTMFCHRHAVGVLLIAAVLSAVVGGYLSQNIRIDTDNENMLSAELPFRQNSIALDEGFPQFEDNLLIVLDAPSADRVDSAMLALVDELKANDQVFANVYAPRGDPYLRKNSFLYLDIDQLDAISGRLAAAQPFLGTLWQAPNLVGLSDMLALLARADKTDDASLTEAGNVLNRMSGVARAVGKGKAESLDWSNLILGETAEGNIHRRLISVQPNLDYGSLSPAGRAIGAIFSIAEKLKIDDAGIHLRLSGSAVLESEELQSVESGMGVAGLVSVTLVLLIFYFGFRSFSVMAALIVSLVVGLLWTASFAIFALGSLNLISVAFAVLFIGLSVDFGIHYVLRVREFAGNDDVPGHSFAAGGRSVAVSLGICVVTTAIAFFSFLPTSYIGLAELGLIAGVGMFIAFITNITLLPALLRWRGLQPYKATRSDRTMALSRAKFLVIAGLISAVLAAWVSRDVHFDFDPMNLRDPNAPSMQTLFDLWAEGSIQPYSAEVLTETIEAGEKLAEKLKALPEVESTTSVKAFIPHDQNDKLDIIDGMNLFLGPAFYAPRGSIEIDENQRAKIMGELQAHLQPLAEITSLRPAVTDLAEVLAAFPSDKIGDLNRALFGGLPARLEQLLVALDAETITLATLPKHLKEQFVTSRGQARIEINPATDLRDPDALLAFSKAVQSVAPTATGAPITVVEAGYAVLGSFLKALVIAVIGISVVLFAVLRNLKDVLLVFAPVVLAAIWTLAASVLFQVPFNFANVIVLPLLFGLSVDYGIHLVIRARETDAVRLSSSTTPKAIVISALTTVGSFGSIMLSGHPGTASMGMLLTISIVLSLAANLVFLPALMRVTASHSKEG